MNTRAAVIAACIAAVVFAGGCGGSSKHATVASSTNTTAAGSATTSAAASGSSTSVAAATSTTSAGTPPAGAPAAFGPACSLATPSQLQTLLGAPVAGAGSENDHGATYKTCRWNTDQSTGTNLNFVQLSVFIKNAPGDPGFAASYSAGTGAPVSGIGDNATFASKGGGAGQSGESQLIANKGLVSVSVDVMYGGAVAHPNSNSAAMAQVIRDVFSQLNV